MKKLVKNTIKSGVFLLMSSTAVISAYADQHIGRRCGVESPSQGEDLARILDLGSVQMFSLNQSVSKTSVIPVVFHLGQTGVSKSKIRKQIDVLNETFREAAFSFETAEILKGYQARKGDEGTLNVYFITSRQGDYLGKAAFPWEYKNRPKKDRILVQAESVPGGQIASYNQGMTLVHEVGHWLGLLHTFQGGCRGRGDFIEDTTPQRTSTVGCPVGRVSLCPGVKAEVSIHNYMDYSDDRCMDNFTRLQIIRMQRMFAAYRAG